MTQPYPSRKALRAYRRAENIVVALLLICLVTVCIQDIWVQGAGIVVAAIGVLYLMAVQRYKSRQSLPFEEVSR